MLDSLKNEFSSSRLSQMFLCHTSMFEKALDIRIIFIHRVSGIGRSQGEKPSERRLSYVLQMLEIHRDPDIIFRQSFRLLFLCFPKECESYKVRQTSYLNSTNQVITSTNLHNFCSSESSLQVIPGWSAVKARRRIVQMSC
jgi:hypothetical protein